MSGKVFRIFLAVLLFSLLVPAAYAEDWTLAEVQAAVDKEGLINICGSPCPAGRACVAGECVDLCEPPCSENQACVANTCVDILTLSQGAAVCSSNNDCKTKLSSAWVCKWGLCVKNNVYATKDNFDSQYQLVVRTNDDHETASKQGYQDPATTTVNVPELSDVDFNCLYAVNITYLHTDDLSYVCPGGLTETMREESVEHTACGDSLTAGQGALYGGAAGGALVAMGAGALVGLHWGTPLGGPVGMAAGAVIGAFAGLLFGGCDEEDHYTFSNYCGDKVLIINPDDHGKDWLDIRSTNTGRDVGSIFRTTGAKSIFMYVDDFHGGTDENWNTRYLRTKFDVVTLNPNVLQKCAIAEGDTKPRLTFKCNMTQTSCFDEKGGECIDCSKFNEWVAVKATKSCEGAYSIITGEQQYDNYTCKKEMIDKDYGIYKTCASSATASRQVQGAKKLCKYGCDQGNCKNSSAPTLSSITINPRIIGLNDTVVISAMASDSDTISDGNTSRKEKIKLECATKTNGTADLCVSEFADQKPNCTVTKIPDPWKSGGNKTVYCKVKDESDIYSNEKTANVMVDVTLPLSEITSPEENSAQTSAFVIKVIDSDNVLLNTCFFYTTQQNFNSTIKERLCNKAFTIRTGPGGDCPDHGDCEVSVYATDAINNTGNPFTRKFVTKLIFTNITAPAENSWQTGNFGVEVDDLSQVVNLTDCTYSIYSISSTPLMTLSDSPRPCNDNITITTGEDGDCRDFGENTCKVVVRASANYSGQEMTDINERFFSVDWLTPESVISSSPTGWQSEDFTVSVIDDPKGTVLDGCQYRVVSGGTETVPWTSRPCSTAAPSEINIKVGSDCKHEGGTACRVFVRPLGRNSVPGFGDNATISIIFNKNVTDIDGFSSMGARATYRGINFTGTTRDELRAAMFYTCNASSKIADCIKSYESGQGIGKPVYCGSMMSARSGKCELRCNDLSADYYLIAKGQTLRGPIGTNIVISPVSPANCPTFRTDELREFQRIFMELKETISIQIMEIDTYIRLNGEDDLANSEAMAILNEALLIIDDHLYYMETAMQDLDVYKADEIIQRSENKLDEISALLRRIRAPTSLSMELSFRTMFRYNSTATVPATVTKSGPGNAYGKIYCNILKPSGAERYESPCLIFSASHDIVFAADRIGKWSYSCNVGRSVREDCSFEVNTTPLTGTFEVMPGLGVYMESLYTLSTVQRGRQAMVFSSVHNPDEVEKYVVMKCDFTDPKGFTRKNTSACDAIYPGESATKIVYMAGDILGNWSASGCGVYSSEDSECSNARLDNSSEVSLSYTVAMPDDVFIDSINIPGQMSNGSVAQITAVLQNPTANLAYVTFECEVSSPSVNLVFSDRKPMDISTSADFGFNITLNAAGIWNINKCVAKKSTNSDYSGSVVTYTMTNAGYIDVTSGTKTYFISATVPSGAAVGSEANVELLVRNPSLARYVQVTCQYRTPLNSPATASSTCTGIGTSTQAPVLVPIAVDRTGTWIVESCTLYGSVNDDCSQSSVHDTRSSIGSFSSPGIGGQDVPKGDLYVESISVPSSAYNNSRINALLTARNINPSNSTYAHTGCIFTNPINGNTRHTSSCKYIPANSRAVFAVPNQFNMPGRWILRDCYVNASKYSNCAYSVLYDTSNQTAGIDVAAAQDLFVSMVNAPDTDITNNTEMKIDVTVNNPLADDRFGSLKCTIANPFGATQTKTTDCVAFQARGSRQFSLPLVVNSVGTWIVSSCSVTPSSSSSCSGTPSGELVNGDTFEVVRGYNLQFSSLKVDDPTYMGALTNIEYTINNPSGTDRFGRVKCTATKGSMAFTNMSGCFLAGRESFASSNLVVIANSTGTWSLICAIERSFEADCSSPVIAEITNRSFEVELPPDMFIQSIDAPLSAPKDKKMDIIVKIRNLGLQKFYGFAGCTFKNGVNETFTNTSSCENMTRDTISAIVSYTPTLRGKLDIFDCYINGATAPDCSGSERHNISTITKSVTISSTIFSINNIFTQDRLLVGELIDIGVKVTNNDEKNQKGFVNCTLLGPRGNVYKMRSANYTFTMGEWTEFHLQQKADIAGRWLLQNCNVYRISNVTFLEDSLTPAREINVTTAPPIELCSDSLPCRAGYVCMAGRCIQQSGECSLSNCPGIKDGCYCLQGNCIKCGEGYTCSNAKCVLETPVISTCTAINECPTAMSCVNGVCTDQAAQCFTSADCGSGLECSDGKCMVTGDNQGVVNLIIIVLAAITVPIIIFIYMKRVV